MKKPTAAQLRQLRKDNDAQPRELADIPPEQWPPVPSHFAPRLRVLRNRRFMVQVIDQGGTIRLSINRTEWDERARAWREHIGWDDLQQLKREAGYGDRCAVEVFPPDDEIVNVANMRHLWLVDEPAFMWRK